MYLNPSPLAFFHQGSVQSIALITFGFMDFETFVDQGLGLGEWKPTIIVVFWITVAILLVISQNIVLSIVVNAYNNVRSYHPSYPLLSISHVFASNCFIDHCFMDLSPQAIKDEPFVEASILQLLWHRTIFDLLRLRAT